MIDYEKKYKEALERAKDWFSNGEPTEHTKSIIYNLFPEIKESEEKKNWEIIIGYIPDEPLRIWLEKQKEKQLILKDQIESLQAALVAKDKTWEARMAEQKTQSHWSDEDERLSKSVIWHLRNSINNGDTTYSAGQLEDWLKNLKNVKTQSQWKPTLEQMKALYEAARGDVRTTDYKHLRSLYDELKPLYYNE